METPSNAPDHEPQLLKPEPKAKRKARTKPVQDGGPSEPPKHSVADRFEIRELHRSELRGAPYNPRTISDAARRKLRAGIEKVGNLAPIIWNKRSGNIVSGHQRVDTFDKINGSSNYTLTVSVVDLDDAAEKEANILLNNPEAQGEYDFEKLAGLLRDPGVAIEGTGFDSADVYALLGDEGFADRSAEDIDGLAEKLAAKRAEMDRVAHAIGNRDASEFMIVVVCRSPEERDRLLAAAGWPLVQWHASDALAGLLRGGEGAPSDDGAEGEEGDADGEPDAYEGEDSD